MRTRALLLALVLASCRPELAPAPAPPETTGPCTEELLSEGVIRFDAGCEARAAALPSYALLDPARSGTGREPVRIRARPSFGNDPEGRHGFTLALETGTTVYGLGEHPGPLNRAGQSAILWNTDAYGYGEYSDSVYQSHPWILAVRADGSAYGVLADTTFRVYADIDTTVEIYADGPEFPVLVIEGDSPQEVVERLGTLTGTIEMPPLWALGYHQCRYSYAPASRVLEVARGFRDRKIPLDTIWMDIDYMDEFRIFTFDPEGFPDPKGLNTALANMNVHNVWMINPGVAADPAKYPDGGFPVHDALMEGGHAIASAEGPAVTGEVWPGLVHFPDFTDPDTRAWWATLYDEFAAQGVTGVWNDMNEPAIFSSVSKTLPEDAVHRGEDRYGGGGPHARFHNVYGMLMAQATRDGMMAARPDARPFVLTRAGYLGSHRWAATWTGDNSATWPHLDLSVAMVLSMGLSGQPFVGPDIGGFVGNGDEALFARWIGFGALFPFARGHTAKNTIDKEPWAFGPEVEATARAALELRYRLLPYLYTLFYEAHRTGLPVWRPVFFADPHDPALRDEDDAFLIGESLLVVPQLSEERDRTPVLPAGEWRRVTLADENPDLPILRVKPGRIVPVGPVMQWTGEKPLDPLTLIVSLDANGEAEGELYEDAGDGWGFRQGDFRLTTFRAQSGPDAVEVTVAGAEGSRSASLRAVTVRVLQAGGGELSATGTLPIVRIPLP